LHIPVLSEPTIDGEVSPTLNFFDVATTFSAGSGLFCPRVGQEHVSSKKFSVDEIWEDLRSGLGDVPVMEKYQISPSELVRIRRHFEIGPSVSDDFLASTQVDEEQRSLPRQEPLYQIAIRDADNPRIQGIVSDIHLKGLRTVGITVQTGEVKALMVPPGPFQVHATFSFEAQCRWSTINDHGECVAGFQITNIAQSDARELEALIEHLSITVTR